jgi:hypothetical protein
MPIPFLWSISALRTRCFVHVFYGSQGSFLQSLLRSKKTTAVLPGVSLGSGLIKKNAHSHTMRQDATQEF